MVRIKKKRIELVSNDTDRHIQAHWLFLPKTNTWTLNKFIYMFKYFLSCVEGALHKEMMFERLIPLNTRFLWWSNVLAQIIKLSYRAPKSMSEYQKVLIKKKKSLFTLKQWYIQIHIMTRWAKYMSILFSFLKKKKKEERRKKEEEREEEGGRGGGGNSHCSLQFPLVPSAPKWLSLSQWPVHGCNKPLSRLLHKMQCVTVHEGKPWRPSIESGCITRWRRETSMLCFVLFFFLGKKQRFIS